jgi:hypothetical protein
MKIGNKQPPQNVKTPAALYGSNIHPAVFTIGSQSIQLGAFVAKAHADSGLSVDDWNGLPEADRDARIDAVVVAAGGPSSLPPATTLPGAGPEGQEPPVLEAPEGSQNPPEAAEPALQRMKAPHPGAGCNLHGVEYVADEDGFVDVPAHAADHLIPHGYSRAL